MPALSIWLGWCVPSLSSVVPLSVLVILQCGVLSLPVAWCRIWVCGLLVWHMWRLKFTSCLFWLSIFPMQVLVLLACLTLLTTFSIWSGVLLRSGLSTVFTVLETDVVILVLADVTIWDAKAEVPTLRLVVEMKQVLMVRMRWGLGLLC